MLTYITTDDYMRLLGTDSIPNDFNKLNIEASSFINKEIGGRVELNNIPEEVKYATCLIMNLMEEEIVKLKEVGNLKSQNIEGWSETYSTPEEVKKNYLNQMMNVLETYLWNVYDKYGIPLLYRGVGVIG